MVLGRALLPASALRLPANFETKPPASKSDLEMATAFARRITVVLIFILATIITPTPDTLTLIAVALPMCVPCESCIWIA
jgi:hypothetical protein